MNPHGVELADLVDHLQALAASSRDQPEADRWRRIAGLWCTDPLAARVEMARWEEEVDARSDPATTAAFLRHAAASKDQRANDIVTEAIRRKQKRRWSTTAT